jgi:hypothetical protein
MQRIVRPAVGLALGVLLVGALACGGNTTASPSPSASQPASTARPAPSLTATASPGPPPTLRPGDPPVYADAIARVQQWLDAWMAGDTAAQNAMLEPESQRLLPAPGYSQLLSGEISGYQPGQHISDDDFTLLVDLQLHLPAANESAWGEGVNSRFITFKRADASSPFLMQFATSP